jgi:hypothetical protein
VTRRLAVLAIAAVAGSAAVAQAHEGAHAAINGPSHIGTVTLATNHKFDLPGITIDCPPPEGGKSCRVAATVRTRGKVRVKAGQKKRVLRIGKVAFTLGANRDAAPMHPIAISDAVDAVLARYGSLKAKVYVEVQHDEQVERYFKMVLKDHE